VILDDSWTSTQFRGDAAALAEHADLIALNCQTPLAGQRLRTRAPGVSDADTAIAARMTEIADPWPDAALIDTSGPIESSVENALRVIRPAGADHVWQRRPQIPPD
jgi:predicted kinase